VTLSPLEPTDSPVPAKINPGHLPELKWLPVKSLMVDETYQRPIIEEGRKTIAKIIEAFRWNRFSPIVVTPCAGGLFAIIDGQHRATAALTLGLEKVPCQVVAASEKEAPAIFASINGTVTSLSAMALFKAGRAAGEEWALAVDRVCRKAGLEPLTYPVQRSKQRPRQTMLVGTIARYVMRSGEKITEAVLEGVMRSPSAEYPGFLTSRVLKQAMNMVHSVPNWEAQREAVLVALGKADYSRPSNERGRAHHAPSLKFHVVTSDVTQKIRDLHGRQYSKQAIAATLRVPYDDVEKVLSA
jgi:hypothetical protein